MATIERRVVLDTAQPEQALVRLRATFTAPREALLALTGDLRRLETEATKLASVGLTPLAGGLDRVSVKFKTTAVEASQGAASLRALAEANQRTAQSLIPPANAMEAYLRTVHGGAEGLARLRTAQLEAQHSARTFATTVFSEPIPALKAILTDSRAAGAATAFLKAQLDFVINSRFGTIAIGFAVFGTAGALIKAAVSALTEFEDKFSRIRALSVGAADASRLNAEAQAFLRNTALATGVSLTELTDKYLIAASATNSAKTAQALFTNALTLSKATGADFADTLLQLNGVFNVFGDQLGKTLTDEEKLRVISSQLFTTFALSAGTGQDFTQALKFLGAGASIAGISFSRTLGIIGLLNDQMLRAGIGARAFDQVLKTISTEAAAFERAFGLGLTRADIVAAPVAALDALREKFKAGAIGAIELQANVQDIFPKNAVRAILDFVQANDALVQKYVDLIQKAQDVNEVHKTVFQTLATGFGQLKAIGFEIFLGTTGNAKALNTSLESTNRLAAAFGALTSLAGSGWAGIVNSVAHIQLALLKAASDVGQNKLGFPEARDELAKILPDIREIGVAGLQSAQRLARFGLGITPAVTAFDELKKKAQEAEDALQKVAKQRVKAGEEGRAPSSLQKLEIDLARGLTVALREQIRTREEEVAVAERAFHIAITAEEKERAKTQLVNSLNALRQTQLKGIQDQNEEILLQSERITERHRTQAVITQAFANEEITARRRIIAALQGQQAQVESLIAASRLGHLEGTRLLVQLEREQNAQLQSIRRVTEEARRAVEQREEAEHRVLRAGERVGDLVQRRNEQVLREGRRLRDLTEDRQLLEQRQTDQRLDAEERVRRARSRLAEIEETQPERRIEAETQVRKAQERIDRELREQQQAQRRTLEQQALGRVRLLLGFPEQANELLLVQLDRLREAQATANLPLQERIRLLEQEFGLLEKIRGKEESRLDLEIQFGSQLEKIQEQKRRAVEVFLASDPVRQAAAERKARLQFGRVSREAITAAAGPAIGIMGLEPESLAERNRQTDEIQRLGERLVVLERLINQGLAVQLAERTKIEREHADRVAEAIAGQEKALTDRARLWKHQPEELREATEGVAKVQRDQIRMFVQHERETRSLNEAIADAQAERIRNEQQFAVQLREAQREQERAQRELQRLQGAGAAGRPELFMGKTFEERQAEGLPTPEGLNELFKTDTRDWRHFFRTKEEADRAGFQRQSFAPEGDVMEQIRRLAFEIDRTMTLATGSSLQRIVDFVDRASAKLSELPQKLPAAVSRSGRSLIARIEEELIDRLTREINYPTGLSA